jgi:dolichol-phosphate mannosyltransferase
MLKEASKDSRILAIKLSKNFELDAAFTCGLDNATADCVVIMASDLQDPPELIPQMLERANEGVEQVLIKIVKRDSVPFLYRYMSQFFYSVANRMTSGLLPRGVSDFRLLTKPAYIAARSLREQNRFLRGLMAWTGFSTSIIEIERPPRFGGESKFLQLKFSRVFSWAVRAILAHTTTPLIAISILGFFSGILAGISTIVFAMLWLINGVPFAGYGTIVGLITLGFSIVLLALGIIAQYIALIYEEVKSRPLYVISEKFSLKLEIEGGDTRC